MYNNQFFQSSFLDLRKNIPATQQESPSQRGGDSKPVMRERKEIHIASSELDMIERRLGLGSNADLLLC